MSEGRRIEIPGASLAVERVGDGPAAIFLHGFGGDLATWDDLWDGLHPGRCHIRYDLRGFGGSIASDAQPFHHADDLLAVMDALHIDRCDLVGLSMGGSIALNFALSHPARVRSLALLSPGLTAWDWSDEWRDLWRPMTAAARVGDMALAKQLWTAHPLFDTVRASVAAETLHKEIARFSGAQWINDRQAPSLPDLERLHDLQLPLLLLTGARDMSDFRLIADLIEAAVPQVVRHDAPDLGHMVHLEAPLWCAERLEAFWTDLT